MVGQILTDILPIMHQVIFKQKGSRLVQSCLTFGTEEQKEQIISHFLDNNKFLDLVKSQYGHHTALKIIGFVEKKEHIAKIKAVLVGKSLKLVTLTEGCRVLNTFYTKKCNSRDKRDFIAKMENISEDRIDNMALKVLEKETYYCELGQYVVYKAFRGMIPQERTRVFELLKENICDLVVTKVGTLLVLDLIAYGGAKDRKAICRQLKTIMPFILQAQHKKAINVLNKLILEIDDVVVLNRLLLNVVKANIGLLFDRE